MTTPATPAPIIHEIGHAVGLWHEQSRADRDRYVTVLYQNIDKRYIYNFEQELTNGADVGSYDTGSIMHYSASGFSRNGQATIETIPPGISIGVAQVLSAADIDGVRRLYELPATPPPLPRTPGAGRLGRQCPIRRSHELRLGAGEHAHAQRALAARRQRAPVCLRPLER